jgi:hypothetical protein
MGRIRIIVISSLLLASLALTGCDIASTGPLSTAPTAPSSAPRVVNASPSAATSRTPSSTQTTACAGCETTGNVTVGKTVMQDGVQVLHIVAAGESYSPTLFNVKAGIPVRVEFSGKAVGCFKKPVFKSLGKKADMSSGSATIELGPLKPGSYVWASELGVGPGTVVVE